MRSAVHCAYLVDGEVFLVGISRQVPQWKHSEGMDFWNGQCADGTTLELITTLTKISRLRVISWTSVRGYKNTIKTLPEIAK